MCVVGLNLPTVTTFLLLYSLRCGCLIISLWTAFRTIFCFFFFMVSISEMFAPKASPLATKLFVLTKAAPADDLQMCIFYSLVIMIIVESVMLVHLIYFYIGLHNECSGPIGIYLICRFLTLLFEMVFLVVLCVYQSSLIGWYLGFLMFVVLELYALAVVYSYYVDLKDDEDKLKETYRHNQPFNTD